MGGQTTHGMSKTPEFRCWWHMLQRCSNPRNARFARYGGRGIRVCERWRKFEDFFADMGPRPSAQHSIDRENNDGNYEPSNCRWATRSEQQNNKGIYRADHALPTGDAHWTRQRPERARETARANIGKAHKLGSENGNAQLTEAQVKQIKLMIADGDPDTLIAPHFGVRPGTIWFIRTGKHWGHV
jgi:hypothetical protein